jgi:hypothetical protein
MAYIKPGDEASFFYPDGMARDFTFRATDIPAYGPWNMLIKSGSPYRAATEPA